MKRLLLFVTIAGCGQGLLAMDSAKTAYNALQVQSLLKKIKRIPIQDYNSKVVEITDRIIQKYSFDRSAEKKVYDAVRCPANFFEVDLFAAAEVTAIGLNTLIKRSMTEVTLELYNLLRAVFVNNGIGSQQQAVAVNNSAPNVITVEQMINRTREIMLNEIDRLECMPKGNDLKSQNITALIKMMQEIVKSESNAIYTALQSHFFTFSKGELSIPSQDAYQVVFNVISQFCAENATTTNHFPFMQRLLDSFTTKSSVSKQPAIAINGIEGKKEVAPKKEEQKVDDCPVCYEPMATMHSGWNCLHNLCEKCCDTIRKTSKICPECRETGLLIEILNKQFTTDKK